MNINLSHYLFTLMLKLQPNNLKQIIFSTATIKEHLLPSSSLSPDALISFLAFL